MSVYVMCDVCTVLCDPAMSNKDFFADTDLTFSRVVPIGSLKITPYMDSFSEVGITRTDNNSKIYPYWENSLSRQTIPKSSKGFQKIQKDSKGFERIPEDSKGFQRVS